MLCAVWFQPSGLPPGLQPGQPLRRLGPELTPSGHQAHHGYSPSGPVAFPSEKRAPSVEARTAKRRLTRAFSEPIG